MHLRPLLLVVWLALGLSAVSHGQGLPPNAPAGQRFDFAYHVLRSADAAREQGDLRGAMVLYEEALKEYSQLLNEFPNWDPAVTRFRADYCRDEHATLKRELERAAPPPPTSVTEATNMPPAAQPPVVEPAPAPEPAPPATPSATPPAEPEPPMPVPPAPVEPSPVASPTAPIPPVAPASPTNAAPSAAALRALAREHLEQGRAEDARSALMDALRLEPDDFNTRLMIGAAQCVLEQYLDALFVLEPLAQEFPSNAAVQVALSTAHLGLSQPETARDDLTRAIEMEPDSAIAHYNMARVLLLLDAKNGAAAEEHYRRALALGAAADPALDAQWQPAETNASPAATPGQ